MNIKIIYSGRLSVVAKRKIEYMEIDHGTTVKQLINILCDKYGLLFKKIVYTDDSEGLRIPVFINAVRKNMKDVIHDGDTVLFSRIVIGG